MSTPLAGGGFFTSPRRQLNAKNDRRRLIFLILGDVGVGVRVGLGVRLGVRVELEWDWERE